MKQHVAMSYYVYIHMNITPPPIRMPIYGYTCTRGSEWTAGKTHLTKHMCNIYQYIILYYWFFCALTIEHIAVMLFAKQWNIEWWCKHKVCGYLILHVHTSSIPFYMDRTALHYVQYKKRDVWLAPLITCHNPWVIRMLHGS